MLENSTGAPYISSFLDGRGVNTLLPAEVSLNTPLYNVCLFRY